MPAVTVPPRPNGSPIAITQSPTRALVESPNFTYGRLVASTLSTARSEAVSLPITFATYSLRLNKVTVIDSILPLAAAVMTWALVTI